MISQYNSKKISFFSLLGTLSVVCIHAYNIPPDANRSMAYYVESMLSQGIARIAVPLFFIISGYLFCMNISSSYFPKEYKGKVISRVKSLLIPYVLWSGACIICFFFFQKLPATSHLFSSDSNIISEMSFRSLMIKWIIKPYNYQLWYVRNLFFFTLFSPILILFLQSKKLVYFMIPFILAEMFLYDLDLFSFGDFAFLKGISFFCIGGIIVFHEENLTTTKDKILSHWRLLMFLFILIVVAINFWLPRNSVFYYITRQIAVIFGIMGLWFGYDDVRFLREHNVGKVMAFLYASMFFLYCAHEPTLLLLKKVFLTRVSKNYLTCYLFTYCTCILFSLGLAFLTRLCFPHVYYVLTGHRGEKHHINNNEAIKK